MKRTYTVYFEVDGDSVPVIITCIFKSRLQHFLMGKNISGFTLGRVIRFRDAQAQVDKDDFTHETIHARQFYPRGQIASIWRFLRRGKKDEATADQYEDALVHALHLGIFIPPEVLEDFR